MKWINATKTEGLNLELITYWHYKTIEEIERLNAEAKAKRENSGYPYQTYDSTQNILTIYVGSPNPIEFYGPVADEIYKLLIQKTLIV
jgi:hypothetical protein